MASTDAKPFPIKNTAYRVTFPILDADGDLVPGATGLDSEVSKDGGTFADCTNEAIEIATSSGMYYLDLTATEINADTVAIIVKTSTAGAKTTPIVLYPVENTDIPVNVKAIGDTVQSATDLKDFADTGYDPSAHRTQAQIKGTDDIDLSAMQKTSVNAELDSALNTAIPGSPVADSINERIKAIDILSEASGNGDLAAILVDTNELQGLISASKIAAQVKGMDSGVLTATAIATDAITAAKIAANAIGSSEFAQAAADKAKADVSPLALEATLSDIKGTGFVKDIHSLPQCLTATGFATENPPSQNLADYKADISALALEATLTAIKGSGWTNETLKAIKEYVDALETRLTAARAGYLDNLSAGAVALASVCTTTRLSELDAGNIPADLDAVLADTNELQGLITASKIAAQVKGWDNINLTALMKADVKIEAKNGLQDYDLDHLIQVSAGAEEPSIGSYLDQMIHKNASQTFDPTTDSLEAIRDRGDDSWITGAGGDATQAKQDIILAYVDELETRLTAIRAGYLDNLSVGPVALASICTEARLAHLNADISSRSNHSAIDVRQSVCAPDDPLHSIGRRIYDYIDAKISEVGGAVGSGALSCTWTQKDGGDNPMDNVQVWITTDEAGTNVIAGTLLTNSQGKATFMLDAGTYYVWREKGGYNFTNPQTWMVS